MSLAQAMEILQETFDKYAGKDGDSKTLSKAELADMLRNELPIEGAVDQAEVDKFFSALDADGDGVVTFEEFVCFVATLAMICVLN